MFLFGNKNIKTLTDLELIDKFKSSHDNKYLGELYKRYSHLMLGLCIKYLKNKQEAEDEVINIFEKLMVDIKKYEIANFKSWLFMVTKNHCFMLLRNRKSIDKKHKAFEAESVVGVGPEDENIEQKENEYDNLQEAINQLKPEQRACIELFYIHEKCYQEVAEITDYDLKKVKSYIQNGKRNIKIILERINDEIVTR